MHMDQTSLFWICGFSDQKYMAASDDVSVETICMAESEPSKNEPEWSNLPQDCLAL